MKFLVGLFAWLSVGILVTLYEIGELNLSNIAWGLLTITFWPVTVVLEFRGRLRRPKQDSGKDDLEEEGDA